MPTNPVAAASNNAILPLIVFVLVFAFAMTRLPDAPREKLVGFFQAIADTMLIVIGWVLWIGPVGVFALAYVVGARAGGTGVRRAAPLCRSSSPRSARCSGSPPGRWPCFGARIWPLRFTRAVAASQALAFSTQSLARLPARPCCARRASSACRSPPRAWSCRWRSRSSAPPARR